MQRYCRRYTEEGEAYAGHPCPLSDYPRPELVRDSYFCLNGEWDFAVLRRGDTPDYCTKIRVPYSPTSLLSGVSGEVLPKDRLFYRRRFARPDGFDNGRVLLHFGAADQIAEVSLNGVPLGRHEGGYDSFSFDITEQLREENELTVMTYEEKGTRLPWGKQRRRRGGMWYTPILGIWQTVWMECVPNQYVKRLCITADLSGAEIVADGVSEGEILLSEQDGGLRIPLIGGRAHVELSSPRHWSPEDPYLYRFTLRSGEDAVESYFALRTVECRKDGKGVPRIFLNGKPYFLNGLLDQGYYSDGLYTPASAACYERDILAAKQLGFNLLRKHIKVEPSLFYYACDRLGMAVWQDAVNNGPYSFLRDTALPTVGFKQKDDRRLHRDAKTRAAFLSGMERMVESVCHFPSVIGYTVFNEGWGQFDHASAYGRIKSLDPTRLVDSVSGWFQPKRDGELVSDVESVHVYFKPIRLKASDRPLILSEFGGYSYRLADHAYNLRKNYGYRTLKTEQAFTDALRALYLDELLPAIKDGLSAAVYTQLSDVEDETNGLVTYDRRRVKVDVREMQRIARALFSAFAEETR